MRYFSVSIIGSIFYFELENAVFGDFKKIIIMSMKNGNISMSANLWPIFIV